MVYRGTGRSVSEVGHGEIVLNIDSIHHVVSAAFNNSYLAQILSSVGLIIVALFLVELEPPHVVYFYYFVGTVQLVGAYLG